MYKLSGEKYLIFVHTVQCTVYSCTVNFPSSLRIPNPQHRNEADPCQCFFSDLGPQLFNDEDPYPQLHYDADPDSLIRTDADPDPLYCVYLC